jgi:hypothetical protein
MQAAVESKAKTALESGSIDAASSSELPSSTVTGASI